MPLVFDGNHLNLGDQRGITPLMKAANCEQMDALNYLISVEVNLDRQDDKSQTAMFMATNHGKISTAKRLIEAGANLELTDLSGTTVLALAERLSLVDLQKLIMTARR
ncbi:MAG: ankyrin repeat domain-containing protein [Candidatus Riflebacteria bacterium]|nr:ankyrin repeat domain-containing protein [Candidatus Riflebacteria bacterium]